MHPEHLPILLIIGGAILAGSLGGRLFQLLRIPQVVGFIAIGVLIGKSGLRLIGDSEIEGLLPFNFFALGVRFCKHFPWVTHGLFQAKRYAAFRAVNLQNHNLDLL